MDPVRIPTALDGTLQDGTDVQLRPLRPKDSEHLQRGLNVDVTGFTTCDLQRGLNELVFVLTDALGGWGLRARLADLDGLRLES